MGFTLITGASSGIGEEFARQYAKKGHFLILTARSEDKLNKLAQELKDSINDAGIGLIGEFENQDITKIQEMLILNVISLTKLCRCKSK